MGFVGVVVELRNEEGQGQVEGEGIEGKAGGGLREAAIGGGQIQ